MPASVVLDLRNRLSPLSIAVGLNAESSAYQRYYGLDLPHLPAAFTRRMGTFEAAGYTLVAQAWWPAEPKATLIMLHGYYDHTGLYQHLIVWALRQGLAVISCDLPGHGLSAGAAASINEFSDYQKVLQGLLEQAAHLQLPTPWHLCGQSTGGAIVTDYLLHQGREQSALGRSILLAPLVRPRGWRRSQLSYHLLKPFVKAIPRVFNDNSSDKAFIDFVKTRDPLQARTLPTAWVGALARWVPHIEAAKPSQHGPIIIQGDADMTVDWQHNLKVLKEKFSQAKTLIVPGARHHLVNEAAPVREHYLSFLSHELS